MECSGQDLVNPRDRETCPIAPEVPQVDNTLKMPSGSHATPMRESLEPNPETHPNSEERTQVPSHTDSNWTQLNINVSESQEWLHLPRNSHVLNTHYFSGDGYGWCGYLGIPILTMKYDNLNGYERINRGS